MLIHAVVPVKNLHKSKMRLSTILSLEERATLSLMMLQDLFNALKSSTICQICLVASDVAVQQSANASNADYLQERLSGLNNALKQGVEWCLQHRATAVLVLPADVPLITSEDINRIIEMGHEDRCVVASPSLNGGTNALLLKPPNLIPVCFGPNSFIKHVKRASARGVSAKLYRSSRLAVDVDSVEDLKNFFEAKSETASREYLEKIMLSNRFYAGSSCSSPVWFNPKKNI